MEEIRRLDVVDDIFGLDESEIMDRNKNVAELYRNLSWRNTLFAQKARIRWIKEGDVNSRFFHKVINRRRKQNEIAGIRLDGSWCEEVNEVKMGVLEFFRDHYRNEAVVRPSLAHDFFSKKILDFDNSMLVVPFSEQKVTDAIVDCDSGKSPGPEGFNFRFLKEFWPAFREEFMNLMSEFHVNGKLVRGLNSSFVVLIPKKEEAAELRDFRPISLIGGIYKIISKVLANRFRRVLDSVISVNQSTFVGNRQIHDGTVVLNEELEEAKRRNIPRVFLKLDFAKAYDTLGIHRSCLGEAEFSS